MLLNASSSCYISLSLVLNLLLNQRCTINGVILYRSTSLERLVSHSSYMSFFSCSFGAMVLVWNIVNSKIRLTRIKKYKLKLVVPTLEFRS